ncbi:MAG: hypothetical protein ACR5LC_04965 [Symbiopectobacterium sp.]
MHNAIWLAVSYKLRAVASVKDLTKGLLALMLIAGLDDNEA